MLKLKLNEYLLELSQLLPIMLLLTTARKTHQRLGWRSVYYEQLTATTSVHTQKLEKGQHMHSLQTTWQRGFIKDCRELSKRENDLLFHMDSKTSLVYISSI